MIIERRDVRESVNLMDIKEGECFLYDSGYYMMTDDYSEDLYGGDLLGVVFLKEGTVIRLRRDARVIPVKAKVVIE